MTDEEKIEAMRVVKAKIEDAEGGKSPKLPEDLVKDRFGYLHTDFTNSSAYSHSKLMEFAHADLLNEWFKENRGYIVHALGVRKGSTAHGLHDLYYVLVNKIRTDEEIQESQDIASIVEEQLEKKRSERMKAQLDAEEAREKAEQVRAELLELGRKCKDNHGAVIEDNIKLKKEVKKLRKA